MGGTFLCFVPGPLSGTACRKLMRGTMRRCLTFAAILFLSARGPNAQSAPPNARRHAAGHSLSPQAASATGQPANQALQNPDRFPPDPDEFQFDPWDIPLPPLPPDIPFPPDDPYE